MTTSSRHLAIPRTSWLRIPYTRMLIRIPNRLAEWMWER